jgi:hypothetical protein
VLIAIGSLSSPRRFCLHSIILHVPEEVLKAS